MKTDLEQKNFTILFNTFINLTVDQIAILFYLFFTLFKLFYIALHFHYSICITVFCNIFAKASNEKNFFSTVHQYNRIIGMKICFESWILSLQHNFTDYKYQCKRDIVRYRWRCSITPGSNWRYGLLDCSPVCKLGKHINTSGLFVCKCPMHLSRVVKIAITLMPFYFPQCLSRSFSFSNSPMINWPSINTRSVSIPLHTTAHPISICLNIYRTLHYWLTFSKLIVCPGSHFSSNQTRSELSSRMRMM